jgi:hypothetical protein
MLALLAVALYLHVSDALAVHVDFFGQTMVVGSQPRFSWPNCTASQSKCVAPLG